MSTKFDDAIRVHLVSCKGDWLEIAKQAGVSHSWMSKFVNNRIPNPGLRTLERLADALAMRRVSIDRAHQPQEAAHG